MKRILWLLPLIVCGCYYSVCPTCKSDFAKDHYVNRESSIKVLNYSVSFFWEFGILKIAGTDILVKDNFEKNMHRDVENGVFCQNFLNVCLRGTVAERVFLDSSNQVSFECVVADVEKFEYERKDALSSIKFILGNKTYVSESDSSYIIRYNEGSLSASGPSLLYQKSINDSLFAREIGLDKKQSILRYNVSFLNKNVSGYKPLRLDPSILPLESPGYKKLREQEESRMKGD